MRLAAPAALWLLAILPLVILLYMLRSRREQMPVSSVLLWQRTRHELATQLPIRRLERSLLLLLQLLAIAAVALALAQPTVRVATASGEATVIVVDLSASMQATDVTPSRFEAARGRAVDFVRSTQGQFMIIGARTRPTIESGWQDQVATASALQKIRPTDGASALDQAIGLALAQRIPGRSARPRVVVLTDGAGHPQLRRSPGVEFITAGSRSHNVGIVKLYTESSPAGTYVVTHIRNAGVQTREAPLTISVDGRRALIRRIALPPRTTTVSTALVKGRGLITAEVSVVDDLAIDNIAYGLAGSARPRVMVVGAPDRALDEALAALQVRRVTVSRITPAALAQADVIVLNATPPVTLPPGNYLLIGTTATNLPIAAEGTVPHPTIARWSRGHRVLRYVDLEPVQIAQSLRLRPTGGEVLAEGEIPLIWAFSGHAIRAVVTGFTLGHTDLALHPAFPILLSNTLDWLTGSTAGIEAGGTVSVPAWREQEARLTDPGGSTRTLTARDGMFSLPRLDRAGIYSISDERGRRQLVVHVPAAETEIAPTPLPPSTATEPTQTGRDHMVPVWPILIGVTLALLMIEWLLWLRTLPKTRIPRGKSPSGRLVPGAR